MPASEEDVTDSKLKLLKDQLGRINLDHFIISRNKDVYPTKEADSHDVNLNHSKENLIYHETSYKLPITKITNVMDNREGYEKNLKPECRKEHLGEKMVKDRDWENNGIKQILGEIDKLEPHTVKCCVNSLKKYRDLVEADGHGHRSFTCGCHEILTSKWNEKVSCNAQEEIDDNSLSIDTDNTEEQNDEATAVKKLFAFQSGAAVNDDDVMGEEEEEDEHTLKYIMDMEEAENDKAADMTEEKNEKSNKEEEEDNRMHSNDVQEKQESEKSEKSFTKLIDYYLGEVPMSLESLLQPFSISNNNVSVSFIPSEEHIYEKVYKPPLTLSMDSLLYFGENRLSLEPLKPRNVCYRGNIYASGQSNMSDSLETLLLYQAESKVCNLANQNPSLDFNVLTYSSWRKCISKRFLGKNWAYELLRDSDSKFSSFVLKNEDSNSMEKCDCRLTYQKLEEAEVDILSSCSEIHESKNFKDNEVEDSEKMSDSADKENWISNDSFREKDLEMSFISEKEGEDAEEFSWCDERDYMDEKISLDMNMEEEYNSSEYISEKCNEEDDPETVQSLDYWCCSLQEGADHDDFEEGKDPFSSNNSTALSERETGCENGIRFVLGEDEMTVKEMNAPERTDIYEDDEKLLIPENRDNDEKLQIPESRDNDEKLQIPESRSNNEKEGQQSEKSVLVPHRNKDRKDEEYEFDLSPKNGQNVQENCQRMRLQREFIKRKHNRRKMTVKKLRKNKELKEKTKVFQGKIKRNMSKGKQRNTHKFMKQKMVNRRGWLRFDEDGTSPQWKQTMKGFFLPLFGDVQIQLPLVVAKIRCRSGGESNQGRSSGNERSDRGASNNGEQGNGSASSGRGNGREGGSGASGGAGGDDNRKNPGNGNINNSNDQAHQDLKNKIYSKKVNIDYEEETLNVTQHGSKDKKPPRSQTTSSPSLPPPRLDPEHDPQRKIADATRSWIPNGASFPTVPSSSNNLGCPPSDHLSGFPAAEDTGEEEVASGVQHATLSIDQLCFIIGDATRGPPSNMHTFMNMNQCLTHLIHNLNIAANEDSKDASYDNCIICQILSQLLIHMADPEHEGFAKSCEQCAQIFNLIMLHCTVCIEADRQKTRFTQSDLCCKICKFSNWKVEMLSLNLQRLQSKVQKYCDKVLGSFAEPLTSRYLDGAAPMGIGEMEVSALSDMPSTGLSSPSSKHSTSLTISGNIVTTETGEPEQVHPDEAKQPSRMSNTPLVQPTMAASAGAVPAASGSEPPTHSKLMRKPSQRKPLDIPPSIKEENQDQGRKDDIENLIYQRYYGTRDDPYETQKTYGEQNHYGSLPLRNVHDVEQFFSVSTRPQGAPGVGEVVFGHPSLLKLVASFWDRKREECERTQTCPYQHREEGVILAEHKGKFSILHTRYQKHHQWERVSHLGNGMSGKCHLAIDMKTNFQFCCKKIHLLKYAEEELTLWTEFNNRYVVRLYGAIRHGVKIYIFSEFFDGGSLAACIEEQKRLGRRLSHWSAINYFQQLLKVLDFLQKKNVLHEDIKADNILLRQNSTFLAVTDFGTSRRLQDPKELKNKSPVGSPTHWSPEKASMEGHGFPSDLWAAICVLVHMLSGEPPWVKRFLQRAGMLNYIIYARPPPMEDVPNNVQLVVRDLIERGFNKDPKLRPSSSDLLNHQAFSILDKGTPETYFSTLASVAQSSFHAARIAVGSNEQQQDVKKEATSSQPVEAVPADAAVLFEGEVSTGPYQESDSRPDHRNVQAEALPQAVRCKEQETGVEQRNDTSAANENEGAENDVAQYGGDNSSTEPGIDNHSRAAENVPLVVENNEVIKTNERVNQLMAFDIDKLLPQFNELFSGDSINDHSIKSFFIDNYNTEVLNGTRKSALKEYKPGERSEELPNLSIFNASWGTESAMKEEQENSEPVNQLFASEASAVTGVKPSLRNRFLRSKSPSESPVQFQLSSGSDDCTSAELFEPGPSNKSPHASQGDVENQVEDEDFTTARETLSSLNFSQGDVSPTASSGSTLSSSGITSLQQRKPVNLRLDVNCTAPTAKLMHSQSEIKASSSASTSELENKHRSHTWTQISSSSSSHQGGSTPSSSHAFLAFRKTSGASGSSTASSNHSQFSYRPNSIKEEQDRVFQELAVEMLDAYSSSGSDGVLDYPHEDIINDEKSEQEETTDFQTLLHKEIDESKLVGENLKFYNDKGEHLFPMWIKEMPNSWSRLIPRVAQKIVKLGYKHFSIHNIDGFPVELHQALSDHEFKVVELGEPGKYCWCQYCEMRF